VSDGAAGEPRQARHVYRPEAPQLLFDRDQGVDAVAVASRRRTAAHRSIGLRADEAIACQPLAALDGLEQERVSSSGHLEISRDRSLKVSGNLAIQGAVIPLRCELAGFV